MASKTEIVLGTILLILTATAIYISFEDLTIRFDDDKTTFYLPHETYPWIKTVVGRESHSLMDGTSKMQRSLSGITVDVIYDTVSDTSTVTRTTPYRRGPVVKDIYFFDGKLEDIELVPVSHRVEVVNGEGYFYRYEVKDVVYDGIKQKLFGTSFEFGRNIKVEWDAGYRWAWVGWPGKRNTLTVQYDIPTDFEVYNVRLFDPIVNNTFYDANFSLDSTANDCFVNQDFNISNFQEGLTAYYNLDDGNFLNDSFNRNDAEPGTGSLPLNATGVINEGLRDDTDGAARSFFMSSTVINQSLPHTIGFWLIDFTNGFDVNPNAMDGGVNLNIFNNNLNTISTSWSNVTSGNCNWNPVSFGCCGDAFYVFWYNGSTCRVYVNGVEEFSATATVGSISMGYRFAHLSPLFIGTFDEIGFWQRALTPTEITNLYNSGNPVVADRPFNDVCLFESDNFAIEGNQTQFVSNYDCSIGICDVNITVESDFFPNYTSGNITNLSSVSPVSGTDFNYTIELSNISVLNIFNFTVFNAGSNVVPNVTIPVLVTSIVREGEDVNYNMTYRDGNGDDGNVTVDFYVNDVLVQSSIENVNEGIPFTSILSNIFYLRGDVVVINVTPNDNHTPVFGVGSLQTSNITISALELDHGGRDWYIARDVNLTGVHFNITDLIIDSGVNITVLPLNSSLNTGGLNITAVRIFDNGANWIGDGRGGGGGSGGGGEANQFAGAADGLGGFPTDQLGVNGTDAVAAFSAGNGGDGYCSSSSASGGVGVSTNVTGAVGESIANNDSSININATIGCGGGGGAGGGTFDADINGGGGGGGHGGDGGAYLLLKGQISIKSNGTFFFRSGQNLGTNGSNGQNYNAPGSGGNGASNNNNNLLSSGGGIGGNGQVVGGIDGGIGGAGGFGGGGFVTFVSYNINLTGSNTTVDGGSSNIGGTIKVLFINSTINGTYDSGYSALVVSNITNSFFRRENNVSVDVGSRIEPIQAFKQDNLLGFCNATDNIGEELQYLFTWYVNGANFSSGNTTTINFTPGVEINVDNISNSSTVEGQSWILQCSSFDNQDFSAGLNSSPLVIEEPNMTINMTFEGLIQNLTAELGAEINATARVNETSFVCLDVDHPSLGVNFSCGENITSIIFNISFFRIKTNNLSNTTFLFNYTGLSSASNQTFYITSNQYDLIKNFTVKLSGSAVSGSFPTGVRIYINNTFDVSVGSLESSSILSSFSDGDTFKSLSTSNAALTTLGTFRINKKFSVLSATMNLLGLNNSGFAYIISGDEGTTNVLHSLKIQRYDPITNVWVKMNNFTGTPTTEGLGMTINGLRYYGLGNPLSGDPLNQWWLYNPRNDTWTRKENYSTNGGVGVLGSVGCAIDGKGYVGFGFRNTGNYSNDWSVYDPGTDTWNNISSIPSSQGRSRAIAFCEDSLLYAGAGQFFNGTNTIRLNDFYSYNVTTDVWTTLSSLPENRSRMGYFSLNGFLYASMGSSGITSAGTPVRNTMRYNISADEWTTITGGERNTTNPSSFVLDNVSYVCGGRNESDNSYNNCLKNDFNPNSWVAIGSNMNNTGIRMAGSFIGMIKDFEVGNFDDDPEWNHTGIHNNNISVDDFSTAINNFLLTCNDDANGDCFVPIFLDADKGTTMNFTSIEISLLPTNNPVQLNFSLVQNFLDKSSGFSQIPITLESQTNGTINVSDIRFDYAGGNKSFEILAHTVTYNNNFTLNLTYFFSRWNFSFPQFTSFMEFVPRRPTSKNVSMFGQTIERPGLNITALNYGGGNFNYSIYLNESFSCVNLSVATVGTVANKTLLVNSTWTQIIANQTLLDNFGIWWWADLECNITGWTLWEPTLSFRACAVDSVCSELIS